VTRIVAQIGDDCLVRVSMGGVILTGGGWLAEKAELELVPSGRYTCASFPQYPIFDILKP